MRRCVQLGPASSRPQVRRRDVNAVQGSTAVAWFRRHSIRRTFDLPPRGGCRGGRGLAVPGCSAVSDNPSSPSHFQGLGELSFVGRGDRSPSSTTPGAGRPTPTVGGAALDGVCGLNRDPICVNPTYPADRDHSHSQPTGGPQPYQASNSPSTELLSQGPRVTWRRRRARCGQIIGEANAGWRLRRAMLIFSRVLRGARPYGEVRAGLGLVRSTAVTTRGRRKHNTTDRNHAARNTTWLSPTHRRNIPLLAPGDQRHDGLVEYVSVSLPYPRSRRDEAITCRFR